MTLSATELVNFTRCRHLARLRSQGLRGIKSPDIYATKGDAHEKAFHDSLIGVCDIGRDGTPEARRERTLEAMRSGAEWIYHGYFLGSAGQGEVDFLKKVSDPCPLLGTYSYETWDTKLAKAPKPEHILQLCHYSDLLAETQGELPYFATIVGGDLAQHRYAVDEFIDYYRRVRASFHEFLGKDAATEPYPISYCDQCEFGEPCYADLKKCDHLSLTLGIRRPQVVALQRMDVKSVADLALLDMSRFERQKGLTRAGCSRLIEQAGVQKSGKLKIRDPEILRALPPPAEGDLFFDMESDPLAAPDGLEYLFGVGARERGEFVFQAFWALTPEEERTTFERTIDFFLDSAKKFPLMHIYHYGAYEPSHMINLANRYATREAEMDQFLREGRFVDLYTVTRKALLLPLESLSLKAVEPLFGFHRKGEVKAAASSIVVFEQWLETGEGKLLSDIEFYNRTDVEATEKLLDWLRQLT